MLLADEQEDMIDRYLERGDMYLLTCDGQPAAQCVVTDEGEGLLELKSLSVEPRFQGRGFGKALISFIERNYRSSHNALQVGTGDVPSTVGLYKHCGFALSHRVANFFIDNYDHAIIEDGRQLIDMVYLQKPLVATTKEELLRQDESRDLVACGRPLSTCADDGCWDDSIRADFCAHEPTPTPYFILEDLFSRIHLEEDSHLLDVGCGAGRVLAYAVEAGLPLDMPLESFTHFYLFNPFDNNVLLAFLDKLETRTSSICLTTVKTTPTWAVPAGRCESKASSGVIRMGTNEALRCLAAHSTIRSGVSTLLERSRQRLRVGLRPCMVASDRAVARLFSHAY